MYTVPLIHDINNIHISAMEEREFSSPVCYLDFDRVPATPPKPDVEQAVETGSRAAKTAVPVATGSFIATSVANPPATPVVAPISRSIVACAVDSTPKALVDATIEPGSGTVSATGERPSRSE
jgi:hypothetical protein